MNKRKRGGNPEGAKSVKRNVHTERKKEAAQRKRRWFKLENNLY